MTPEEFEQQTETATTGEFVPAVTAAVAAVTVLAATTLATGAAVTAVRALAVRRFGALKPRMSPALSTAVDAVTGPVPVTLDRSLVQVVEDIDTHAQHRLNAAITLAQHAPLETMTDLAVITAPAHRAGTGAQADTRWAATRAVSLAEAAKAHEVSAEIIWVPERDACLACLAYAGLHVVPGELFPAGLSYAKKPSMLEAVPYPPLHPNCRCRIEAWFGETLFEDALKREAQRSVARGFSNSASQPSRADAALKLINRTNKLPKTVRKRAARDVSLGSFSGRHNQKVPDVKPGRK